MKKVKQHKILNHPIAGGILLTFLGLMFMQLNEIVTLISKQMNLQPIIANVLGSVGTILFAVCVWMLYKHYFQDQFKNASTKENIKKGLMLVAIPTLVFAIPNAMCLFQEKLGNPLFGLILGLAPGIMEEIIFRGLILSNAMRTVRKYRTMVIILIVSAVNFGLIHLLNLVLGAGIGSTFTQVIYAVGLGMVFGASYLRTGSLLPNMIAHAIIDVSAFMTLALQQSDGVLSGDQIQWFFVIAGIVLMGLGIYLIRPSKTNEILSVWKEKWSLNPPALPQIA